MRSIGRHWSRRIKRDYPVDCGICGQPFRRSKMVFDSDSGILRCPNDAKGAEARTLDKENAALIRAAGHRRPPPSDGGSFDN